jgi:hypothetical protein
MKQHSVQYRVTKRVADFDEGRVDASWNGGTRWVTAGGGSSRRYLKI